VPKKNQVTINGEKQDFEEGMTLHEVVCALQLEPERVAVELNRTIIKRELWLATVVKSGAEIEIVQFVGGG
jgi:thiamine biosynthesis protein ThiS